MARYREVTISAIVFGLVFGAILNAAIAYAGLKIGFTIGGSAIAAVLGFGILRGVLRRGSILEVNIGQTIASSVNVPNSGVIFTVPVLFLLGWSLGPGDRDFWLITLACVAGALLGCAFIIPLRKQMIEVDRLRFPSATGVATVLKSPGAGAGKSMVLVAGILAAMLVYAPASLPDLGLPGYASLDWRLGVPATAGEPTVVSLDGRESVPVWRTPEGASRLPMHIDRNGDGRPDAVLTKDRLDVGRLLGLPGDIQLIFAIAPFAIGAGFLSGRAGLMVLAGGLLAYFVLNPLVARSGLAPPALHPHQIPDFAFGAINRPLGIGLLLGGALMGVIASLPAIRAALVSIARAGRTQAQREPGRRLGRDELGLRTLILAVLAALTLLFVAADFLAGEPFNTKCPITLRAAEATEQGAAAVLLPAPIDPTIEAAHWRGYAVGFATEEAQRTWTSQWTDQERDAYLKSASARPGWLSGLPLHLRSLLLALIGAAWIWFAGIIIAQCTGMTDWSPISGMALLTVVLVLALAGSGAVLGAILIGAALCVAITVAADMMSDLKTGHLVGAVPRRQQIVELIFAGIGPVITMLVLLVITQVNLTQTGVPIGPGTDTPAPQAQALQAVITGVQGGEMPYALYGMGAALGVLLGLGSFAGLGVLVGLSIYLPFFYIATYGVGCVVQIVLTRLKGARWCENWGVPFAAGLIVGEAILALVVNVAVLIKGLGGQTP